MYAGQMIFERWLDNNQHPFKAIRREHLTSTALSSNMAIFLAAQSRNPKPKDKK